MKSKTTNSRSHTRTTARTAHTESSSARDHYHREKARRARQARPESELLAAAKREYLALLEADAAKGKGGRPKKKAARPADVELEAGDDGDVENIEEGEEVEDADDE